MEVVATRSPARHWAPAGGDWRSELARAVRDPHELCRLLDLPRSHAAEAERAARGFPLLVPRPYVGRITPGDPADPLLVQVLPRAEELAEAPGFAVDPLGEANSPQPGLLAKYQGRSLIVATGACGVHCRFCFRRHSLVGRSGTPSYWESALDRIASQPGVREVILSGGDPLALPDADLWRLAGKIAHIPHISRLRIHTRLPIMIPGRVNDELLQWLRGTRLAPIVVIHVNHPREIDADVAVALGKLIDAGVPVLSQSVLLRGVNDDTDVLAALCERLADLRVIPYYLHQLDRVAGAAHFEVPERTGRDLVAELRLCLPGYAVPRYVRETPGGPCKELLA
jgi:L-lysine 2,3-aminomutase